jgi:hypothetical protein
MKKVKYYQACKFIFEDYIQDLNPNFKERILTKIHSFIGEISNECEEFYIGKTGAPKQRMMNGADKPYNNENNEPALITESLKTGFEKYLEEIQLEKTHKQNGYTKMFLLLKSNNENLIDNIEEEILPKYFIADEAQRLKTKNRNKTQFSRGIMKDTGIYYIYIVTN